MPRLLKTQRTEMDPGQLALGFGLPTKVARTQLTRAASTINPEALKQELRDFREFGQPTAEMEIRIAGRGASTRAVPAFVNEFWTARQRQGSSLHEVSYRACFKPQLPRFFIERLTVPGDVVYDPFMGRGTTLIEAALLGRVPWGNDANPLSRLMTAPRLDPPRLSEVEERLKSLDLSRPATCPDDLLVFYHPKTLQAICALREYLMQRERKGAADAVDNWIRLVALNRLTGHSSGFFSVYTMPPNQAVSVKSQRKINEKRKQTPPVRDVVEIILKKGRQLLGDVDEETRSELRKAAAGSRLLTGPAGRTPQLRDNSVALVVTSPPFLNVVQYAIDNWLRCWFVGIDPADVKLTVPTKLEAWQEAMTQVFHELARIVRPGGHIAFEVGEVHGGATRLEEAALPCGIAAGLEPVLVLINAQEFTKTANCWGIDNMSKGTNTNRVMLFRRIGG